MFNVMQMECTSAQVLKGKFTLKEEVSNRRVEKTV
jgi:hypothetical protein